MTEIDRLKKRITARHPGAEISESYFRYGKIWLDVRLNGEMFVMEYRPWGRCGVTTLKSGDPWEGYCEPHDREFSRFADARPYLMKLLDAADGRPKALSASRAKAART